MGCSSSVDVKKTELENMNTSQKLDKCAASTSIKACNSLTNDKIQVFSHGNQHPTDYVSNMNAKNKEERSQGDGATSSEPSQDDRTSILNEEHIHKTEDTESMNEDENEDSFDTSLKPIATPKEHATQETLNFVYKHGMASSPSHVPGSFPAFGSGNYGRAPPPGQHDSRRRASGVPPPPRELKPGDYLYQKTLNSKHVINMTEEDEEEEEET